jgi:hypothetical protein
METGTVVLVFLTGVAVIVISYALDRLWAAAMPVRAVYLLVRLPGVVLHECAHIAGCLLTGARVGKVVLFSSDGGSVTYGPPKLPFIGDVVINTAPLFLLPLALVMVTMVFGTYGGVVFPALPVAPVSPENFPTLILTVFGTFPDNLVARFNGWFLLYLFLVTSLILAAAPSMQDMKNAAAGTLLLVVAGLIVAGSGIPWAVSALEVLVDLIGYGFTLGLVYGLVALIASLPLLILSACRPRS